MCQRGTQAVAEADIQAVVCRLHRCGHRDEAGLLVVIRQHVADVLQAHENGIGQDEAGNAGCREPWCLARLVRYLLAACGLEGAILAALVHVNQAAVMRHEACFGAEEAAALRRTESEFEHLRWHGAKEQMEQVRGVAAHQCAGEA